MNRILRETLARAGIGYFDAGPVRPGRRAAVVGLVLPGITAAELALRLREEMPSFPVVAAPC